MIFLGKIYKGINWACCITIADLYIIVDFYP